MLWLCIHFPRFSLDYRIRGIDHESALIVASGGRVPAVIDCTDPVREQGVCPGMTVAAARSLAATARVWPCDESSEAAALERVAAWAGRYSSLVSLVPPHSLLLEIAGSLKYFDGLASLLSTLSPDLGGLGYRFQLAAAPTPLAAIWLARSGHEKFVQQTHDLRTVVSELPVSLLMEYSDTLRAMGVETLGDCLRLPRTGLARRLSPGFLQLLDQALGRLPDPRSAYEPPSFFSSRLELPAEVSDSAALLFSVRRLLGELSGYLQSRQRAAQVLRLELEHCPDVITRIDLRPAVPGRDVRELSLLFSERLARTPLPDTVHAVRLSVSEFVTYEPEDCDWFSKSDTSVTNQGLKLAERLRARLGTRAVRRIGVVADHRPEYGWTIRKHEGGDASVDELCPRPVWLLQTPVPLVVREGAPEFGGRLTLLPSRERLQGGWWEGEDMARDYFIARNPAGLCLWVYRDLGPGGGWFVHGLFD